MRTVLIGILLRAKDARAASHGRIGVVICTLSRIHLGRVAHALVCRVISMLHAKLWGIVLRRGSELIAMGYIRGRASRIQVNITA